MQPNRLDSYLALLGQAWDAHLAPREPDAPTVISAFAGAGGSSLGYSVAGFREALAIEWDDAAVATFRRNFTGVPVYHGDIRSLEVEQMLAMSRLEPGQLDVLDGSPPCQGFSMAGKRQISDERNQLFREYVRLLRGLRPKVFVMENVAGMVKGRMKLLFAEIISELKASDYLVSARLMNAMYFNVPQHRERVIFIGVREDLVRAGLFPSPSHPGAQTAPLTFADACWDLRGNAPEDRMLPAVLLRCAPYQPDKWSTNPRVYRHFKGNLASAMSLNWAGWRRVCGTITKSEISLSGIVHPDRERYISLAEAKRLGSFPDQFQFSDRRSGIAQIGNSVPPLFMRAIATHVRREILSCAGSENTLALPATKEDAA